MINLLPNETRESLSYARRNTVLVRWLVALSAGLVGIMLVIVFGLFYIDFTTQQIDKQVENGKKELVTLKIEETQKRVENMSDSFKLVTQVLSQQVLFSEVLKQVGAVMPNGSLLANLSVEQLQGGVDLLVISKDYQTASQVQVNLQDPANKLFDKVDIISITCDTNTTAPGGSKEYPCTGRYRVLFSKDNSPFLFLNKSAGDVKS